MIHYTLTLIAALASQPLGPPAAEATDAPPADGFYQVDLSGAEDRRPGLIGTAAVNGPLANMHFNYFPGKLWSADVIPELFYDGDYRPPVTVQLHGYFEVPEDCTVNIWHAGGGVNGDVSELIIGGRSIGIVGDDTLKNVIYELKLRAGTYDLHWFHTTAGVYQPHFLKIEVAETGDEINCYHLERFLPTVPDLTTANRVEVAGEPADWAPTADRSEWYVVNLIDNPALLREWAGHWRAEFANGIVQTYTLSADGSATVDAGAWHDTGTVEKGNGYFIVRFSEDRAERWTRVGGRMVIEHWFPASRLPTEPPVLGIAEQSAVETAE